MEIAFTLPYMSSPDGRRFRLDVPGQRAPWWIESAAEKLDLRSTLPGAFCFDSAAVRLRSLAAAGARDEDTLALAFPGSWLVNSPATSRAFRAWSTPPRAGIFRELLALLPNTLAPEDVIELTRSDTGGAALTKAITALTIANESGGLCAISKVLALVRPTIVPLCDDRALAFSIGHGERGDADAPPSADASAFVPMIRWFAYAQIAVENELIDLAREHVVMPYDAAQILDRLLWFDSAGYRHWSAAPPYFQWTDEGGEECVRIGDGPADTSLRPVGLRTAL